ncbi:tryptophan transporter [Peptostreptococcus equinus]|uniref:Tryptophan transporter n=1 Tax=Peptostreptococcus equinus TaxID=3003601 RepID=A0ABY7JPB4_9FIRM|nr:tryptophan transporter [Peptostreptococcus sp. CBA3647]WAW13988.1 tryptophan transporter [Peptostreptococcus sp. CBA3647]
MRKSNTKKMIINAILLGVGLILNQIFPPIGGGITPDITLVMLFCIMLLNRDDYKTCLIAGIATGVFSALTTKFPMGQVPNLIDKVVTVNVVFLIMRAIYISPFMKNYSKIKSQVAIGIMTVIGTLISGFIFLFTASMLVGLPGGLMEMLLIVVVPSTLINLVASLVLYNIISVSLARGRFQISI